MIKYSNLGPDRQLNEVVLAGSHDAGVTGGDANTKTQSLDIADQASAGVRSFDIPRRQQQPVGRETLRRAARPRLTLTSA